MYRNLKSRKVYIQCYGFKISSTFTIRVLPYNLMMFYIISICKTYLYNTSNVVSSKNSFKRKSLKTKNVSKKYMITSDPNFKLK